MKTLVKFFAVLTVLAFSFAPGLVRAQDAPPDNQGDQSDQGDQGASFQTFYDQLGDQGTWIQTDNYGYVFQPNVTDPDWAPYTDGHWVYTDVGWTWVSDEPWGWATYHYGRWCNINGTGWVWVPGYRWAPAWVSWRYGGGYCGWAPLPPESFVGVEYGGSGGWASFHFGGDVDVSFGIGAGCYNFVSVGDMGEPNYRGHYIDRSRNYTVINNTTNITNINVTNNYGAGAAAFRGVVVKGPPLNAVNAHSRQHIQTVQLTAQNQPGRSNLQGNSLAVYAPRMNPASVHEAKPAMVSQTLSHPTLNRGTSITKPLDVTAGVKAPAPTPEAIQAAQAAQLHASAKAKIATEKTTVKTPLTKPLTSMEPVAQVHHAASAATPAANPNEERSTASSPYTGESVNKPETTYHPETEVKPAETYHPESVVKPAETYHPQSEVKPTETYHPQSEVKPAETYHPESEVKPAESYHPSSAPPAETYHPQPQATHEAPPPTHAQAPPANKPAPTGGQGNKPAADNKNKPQGQ